MGPKLVALHTKYKDRGVQFVSVTDMHPEANDRYVRGFGIPWPAGHGLPVDTVVRLGAVNAGMAAHTPGYLVAPTVYLVGPDGKVLWSDGRGRWRHEKPDALARRIKEALDEALR